MDEIHKLCQEIDDFIGLTLVQKHEAQCVPRMLDISISSRET